MTAHDLGLVGRKLGMTRVYTDDGRATPVTVVEVQPNVVVSVRTPEKNGYAAVQLTVPVTRRKTRPSKALAGHYKASGVTPGRGLWECRISTESQLSELKVGGQHGVGLFSKGQRVDVRGRSKGKGFQSGIRRWNFRAQDATHGNSLSHRSNGSIGQCQTPGRVWKGKKMSGHQGAGRVTVQGLEVFKVDDTNKLLLLKGSVPGANGADVLICPSVKRPARRGAAATDSSSLSGDSPKSTSKSTSRSKSPDAADTSSAGGADSDSS